MNSSDQQPDTGEALQDFLNEASHPAKNRIVPSHQPAPIASIDQAQRETGMQA